MFRHVVCSLVLTLLLTSTSFADAVEAEDISDLAMVLTVAGENLSRGTDGGTVRKLLDTLKEPLRGTPYRLLQHVSTQPDTKQALQGKPVPKPENLFRLAVLHPTEPKVVFVCDQGVLVVQEIAEPDAPAVKLVTSRAKPLAYGAFSNDGKFFAVGDSEGGIVIWDTQTWKETKTFVKGQGIIRSVGLNKTGSKLMAETDAGLVLWDVGSGDEVAAIGQRLMFGHSFCFSDDEQHFATGGLAHVNIHDIKTGDKVLGILHGTHTMQLGFSSDGRLIASGLRGVVLNRYLGVFDVATGKTIFDHAEHGKGVTGVVFLDNDKCVLSTAADGVLRFWHVPTGTELLQIKVADSIYQPTCHQNGSLILWNQRSGPRYFSLK